MFRCYLPLYPITIGTLSEIRVLNISTASFSTGFVIVVTAVVGSQRLQFGSTRLVPCERGTSIKSKKIFLILKYLNFVIRFYDFKQMTNSQRD